MQQIATCEKMIQETELQKKEWDQKLMAAKSTERMNDEGIMIGSLLIIQIVDARELLAEAAVVDVKGRIIRECRLSVY